MKCVDKNHRVLNENGVIITHDKLPDCKCEGLKALLKREREKPLYQIIFERLTGREYIGDRLERESLEMGNKTP